MDAMAGAGAVGRQVDLKGVTIVGERVHDSQRFALVILNQRDDRRYVHADELGTQGAVAYQMEQGIFAFFKKKPASQNSLNRAKVLK